MNNNFTTPDQQPDAWVEPTSPLDVQPVPPGGQGGRPPGKERPKWMATAIAAVAGGLVVGGLVGVYAEGKMQDWREHSAAIAAERDDLLAAPAPTVTATRTVTAEPVEPVAPATFEGRPEDFAIAVTITEQQCFGSAGCNVSYRVDPPEYTGSAMWPDSGTVELIYEITGAEDKIIGSMEIDAETSMVSWDDEGSASTETEDSALTAQVTKVTYLDY